MTNETRLEQAGAVLRAATSSIPFPELRTSRRFHGGLVAAVTGLALVLVIGIPAYVAQTPVPGGGAPLGAADSTTTTQIPEATTTTTPGITTTTITGAIPSFACDAELPWNIELPEDFTGPHDGPSPHSSRSADDGQTIVHWLGRDGSVEVRWPVDSEYLEGVQWGETPDWTQRDFSEFALFLFTDPDPGTFATVGASEVLPAELMEGPCDAAQLSVYAPRDSEFSSANSATFGPSGTADVVIYPNLPRPRDKLLVVETLEVTEIPDVVECGGGPGVEDVPPNKSGTTPDSPVFDTPEEALENLLSTDVAETWPKKGYFELVMPNGTIIYANPYDDLSPNPRPDGAVVVSVTVVEQGNGWAVTEWETSGC
jgi:hypothetical protein